MSTVSVTNLKHGSSASNNLVLDSSGNVTAAGTMAMATPFAMRNKIINGAMEIDQRNAGASVGTASGIALYCVDRWRVGYSQTSKLTIQQNAGSVTPPPGFSKYLGITSSSAYSLAAGDYFIIDQPIEGLNVLDLAWGTANAKTVTLSFWVRSSLTGTFSGAISNANNTRSYVYTYSVSSANTWEYKTVTIAGDTTGTWPSDNTVFGTIEWSLGMGSTRSTTAGSWIAGNYHGATGAISVVGTNGATFYLTGVQLEVGSVATPFERRLYTTELQLCQRYFCKSANPSILPAQNNGDTNNLYAIAAGTIVQILWKFPATLRAAPTLTTYNPTANNANWSANPSSPTTAIATIGQEMTSIYGTSATAGNGYYLSASASAEL